MKSYKLAVDLGSTTIGYAVVDAISGKITKEGMIENPGRLYGRDIFSRIGAYRAGGASRITSAMRGAILDIVKELSGEADHIVVSTMPKRKITTLFFKDLIHQTVLKNDQEDG